MPGPILYTFFIGSVLAGIAKVVESGGNRKLKSMEDFCENV